MKIGSTQHHPCIIAFVLLCLIGCSDRAEPPSSATTAAGDATPSASQDTIGQGQGQGDGPEEPSVEVTPVDISDEALEALEGLIVAVDDQPISLSMAASGELHVHAFGDEIAKAEVNLINFSQAPIELKAIDWRSMNQHVWLQNGSTGDLPKTLMVGDSYSVEVHFDPPTPFGPVDTAPAILDITVQGESSSGDKGELPIGVHFTMPEVEVYETLTISPPSYTYSTATPTSPGEHTFYVHNDCGFGSMGNSVEAIEMETQSDEFKIVTVDPMLPYALPAAACTAEDPGALSFTLRYTPQDGSEDQNAVLIYTSAHPMPSRVPVQGAFTSGSWSLAHSHMMAFDFANVTTSETRSVLLSSDGPGPLKVKEPTIEDSQAAQSFSYVAYAPQVSAGGEETLITSWPRALADGNSIRFDVTYTPPLDPSQEPSSGELLVEVETPESEEIAIDLFAGTPKGKLEIAPKGLSVTVSALPTESGARHVVLTNEGNAPLSIEGLEVSSIFGGVAEHFTLQGAPSPPFEIPVDGFELLTLGWSAPEGLSTDGVSEKLQVSYFDLFTGMNVHSQVNLTLVAKPEGVEPIGEISTSAAEASVPVGSTLGLTGSASGLGDYELFTYSFLWYLIDKPAGSGVMLNANAGFTQTLTPDQPGEYLVELIVIGFQGADFVVAPPAFALIEAE